MHAAPLPAFRQLSPVRISGWSGALALHAVAFALMVMPPTALLPEVLPRPESMKVIEVREVVRPQTPAPPIPPPPRRAAPPTPTRTAAPVVPVILAESALPVPVATAPTTDFAPEATAPPAGPTHGASIEYAHAPPPPYPAQARRRGQEGDVMLRVRVGVDGRPQEVMVERSSGHRQLDRAASEHVLATWRFQPAMDAGSAVEAWARVPIRFRIERI